MVFLEANLNECRMHGGVRRRQGRQIRHHTDVRHDGIEFVGGYNLMNNVFHLLHIGLGDFKTGTCGGFDIDHELPRIRARKEGEANEGIQSEAYDEDSEKSYDHHLRAIQNLLDPAIIGGKHPFKADVEPNMESRRPRLGRCVPFRMMDNPPENSRAVERHNRYSDEVRGE